MGINQLPISKSRGAYCYRLYLAWAIHNQVVGDFGVGWFLAHFPNSYSYNRLTGVSKLINREGTKDRLKTNFS